MVRGAGSISSPIIISDDEDEAFVESQLTLSDLTDAGDLTAVPSASIVSPCERAPSTRTLQPPSSVSRTVGYSMALRMGFRPGRGLGPQLDGRIDPLSPSSLGLKRKRNDSGIGFQSRPDNLPSINDDEVREKRKKQRQDQSSSKVKATNTTFPLPNKPPEVKIQKGPTKGKGKRAALGPQPHGKSSVQTKGKVPLSTSQLHCTPASSQISMNQPPSSAAAASHPLPQPQAQQFSNTVSSFHNGFPFPGPELPELWQMQYWLGSIGPPYLPWQDLMNSLPGDHLDPPNHVLTTSHTQDPPLDVGLSSSNDASGSHDPTKAQAPVSVSKAISKRSRSKNLPSIGRGPEADPQSTHGTYTKHLSSQPNPACTVVLDCIPQRYRTVPWVASWAINTGRVRPVQVDLDTKKGKGLVEFPDATAARKAFNSKQLRGKGRQAIRAWWYRVVGVGSKSGVGEIEEGEIEDTTTGKDDNVLPLTRKQRKRFRVQISAAGPSVPGQANGKDTGTSTDDPDPGGTSPSPERLHIATAGLGSCAPMEVGIDKDLNGRDRSSIASSGAPSIRLCTTPPPNDMEDMIMSSPLSVLHSPYTQDLLLEPADLVGTSTDRRPPGDESTSATVVDASPIGTKSTTVPTVNDSSILDPVPQVVDITPDELQDLEPAVTRLSQLIPSEPRGFRDPPIAPSFTRRFLLARQKELQDKIVQSKLALGLEPNNTSSTPSPSTSTSSSSVRNTPSAADRTTSEDKLVMEQNLRRLVMESKTNGLTSSGATPTDGVPSSMLAVNENPTPSSVSSSTHATSGVFSDFKFFRSSDVFSRSDSLETLAVSFITESIESAKQSVFRSVPSNMRHELATRQERLERYIAESKALMAKLNQASNKEEKENILSAMRECSRCVMKPEL
ncbi:hypothetical protein F5I97DRAFT_1927202 [Phlebopus sp. FC_14]|nr:hypothetical protein F5I97DRAFT_1927202 [Phlebopus sp. FC_14]